MRLLRGALWVRPRAHGNGRKFYYKCSNFHERGKVVCTNAADVSLNDAGEIVIEVLLDDVLDASIVPEAVDQAIGSVRGDGEADRVNRLDAEVEVLERIAFEAESLGVRARGLCRQARQRLYATICSCWHRLVLRARR